MLFLSMAWFYLLGGFLFWLSDWSCLFFVNYVAFFYVLELDCWGYRVVGDSVF